MVTVNFKYGDKFVSIKSTKIFVSFETKTLTLYFDTKEEAKAAADNAVKLTMKVTNFGKYIIVLPQYNTNINFI